MPSEQEPASSLEKSLNNYRERIAQARADDDLLIVDDKRFSERAKEHGEQITRHAYALNGLGLIITPQLAQNADIPASDLTAVFASYLFGLLLVVCGSWISFGQSHRCNVAESEHKQSQRDMIAAMKAENPTRKDVEKAQVLITKVLELEEFFHDTIARMNRSSNWVLTLEILSFLMFSIGVAVAFSRIS